MKINLDIKSLLIIVLLITSIYFGYKWYYSTDFEYYKEKIEELERSNIDIKSDRDSIQKSLSELTDNYNRLVKIDLNLKENLAKIDFYIENTKQEISGSEESLIELKNDLEDILRQIEEIKSGRSKKEDSNILESIKKRLLFK